MAIGQDDLSAIWGVHAGGRVMTWVGGSGQAGTSPGTTRA
jgi:hypothetical protein